MIMTGRWDASTRPATSKKFSSVKINETATSTPPRSTEKKPAAKGREKGGPVVPLDKASENQITEDRRGGHDHPC